MMKSVMVMKCDDEFRKVWKSVDSSPFILIHLLQLVESCPKEHSEDFELHDHLKGHFKWHFK